jgi:hypothetical protein
VQEEVVRQSQFLQDLLAFGVLKRFVEDIGASLVDDLDLLRGHSQIVYQVIFGLFADGHNPVCVLAGILAFELVDLPVQWLVIAWITQEDEVVNSDNGLDSIGSLLDREFIGQAVIDVYLVLGQLLAQGKGTPQGAGLVKGLFGLAYPNAFFGNDLGAQVGLGRGSIQEIGVLRIVDAHVLDYPSAIVAQAGIIAKCPFGIEADTHMAPLQRF